MKFLKALLALTLTTLTLALPAQAQSYRVQPGDVLRIEVIEDAGLNRDVLVSPDGTINVPLAGSLSAAGRSTGAIQSDLAERLSPNFASRPNVYVSLGQLAQGSEAEAETITVYMTGEMGRPGAIEVKPGTTFLQAVAAAGGLTSFAAQKRLLLQRNVGGKAMTYRFNYRAITQGGSQAGLTPLREGDVIVAPQRGLFE
ncbi:polysaccharide biosynthesis/export family protein [Frigidibacter sp. MR17.24]|uniref:polysaccharide biosynthesis/export family protein n=1 Tax=Frigidibacter sp. MR17.24 TaxID=3127345 RepID=UPI0030129DD4